MRVVLAALLLVLGLAGPAQAQDVVSRVVVVGVAGLDADAVRQDPALSALPARGALSVKAAGPRTCLADAWLTLGAGNRVEAGSGCGELPDDLDAVRRRAAGSREGAEVGALAAAVRAQGGCVEAAGAGAVLAADGPLGTDCPLRLVDGPAAAELDALRPGEVLLVVGTAAPEEGLLVALSTQGSGALVSASTRRAPYVQLVDVAPTALDLLGLPVPASMTGEPWRVTGEAPALDALADLQQRAEGGRASTVPFFVVLCAALLAGLLAGALGRRPRVVELTGLAGVGALTASSLAMLVPWWRVDPPLVGLLATTALLTVLLTAAVTRTRDPVTAACAVLTGVLLLDLLTGARLQLDAPAGYSPLVAGRFAGIGNVAFGVLAAAALLTAAGLSRRRRLLPVAGVGVAAVVVDGAPPFGSDVGGVLALVPAFVLLALLRSGRPVSLLRLAAAGAAGALVVTAFAAADWTRDAPDRTHLGRFVQDVLDGTAGTLLRRKAEAVLGLLFANPVTALLPLVVAACVLLVARPPAVLRRAFEADPAWRHGLVALGLACLVGFAVNDSGAAVPALAVLVALPATAAVAARHAPRGALDR